MNNLNPVLKKSIYGTLCGACAGAFMAATFLLAPPLIVTVACVFEAIANQDIKYITEVLWPFLKETRQEIPRVLYPTTTLTIRSGTAIILRMSFPSIARMTSSLARAVSSIIFLSDPFGKVMLARTLPFT